MKSSQFKVIWRGVGHGVLAGLVFGGARILSAMALGESAFAPFRSAASVWLGEEALSTTAASVTAVIGTLVHLVLSALFGVLYAALNDRSDPAARSSLERQAVVGLAFGAAVWLFDFRVVAANFFPWLLAVSQWRELVLHALFFGLPLGVTYAASQRTAQPFRREPRTSP